MDRRAVVQHGQAARVHQLELTTLAHGTLKPPGCHGQPSTPAHATLKLPGCHGQPSAVARGGALWVAIAIVLVSTPALAHPEFQAFSKQYSGRGVSCAMCHANADGPDGVKPGQIGRLSPKELERLNKARAAFQPGANVDSPILNAFGNHIVNTLGKEKLLSFRKDPAGLAGALGNTSDLDSDGISDAQEYLDGTHPLDAHSGAPLKLLLNNLRLNQVHVVLLAVAVACALYGIRHLLRWLGIEARAALALREGADKHEH